MKLSPKSITAEYINSDEDYLVTKLMGSINLVYGTPRKKNCKSVAFKNTEMVREVANHLLRVADILDKRDQSKSTPAEHPKL